MRDGTPEITRIPTIPPSRHGRHATRLALELDVTAESAHHFFAGLSGDPTGGGLFVATYRVLPVGTRLALTLHLGESLIHAQAVVRFRVDAGGNVGPGFGVAFEGLGAYEKEAIRAFCVVRPPLYVDEGLVS